MRQNEIRSFKKLWGGKRERMLAHEVLKHVHAGGGKFLDVGCGDGYLLDAVRQRYSYELWGCDVSETRIKRTREHVPSARISYCDYTAAPLERDAFDVVTCCETIEHIDKVESACDNLVASVKHGGRLIITVPNNENLELGRHTCPACQHRFHLCGHVQSFDPKRLEALFGKTLKTSLIRAFGLLGGVRGFYAWMRGYQPPHLVYVGDRV